ncbi:hypothetical protein [Membranihabitans marinus]|uniref:hypothetical protein n=1 Tax=Membranihabitans marinus TaxID=1227546 RepID=UPI001F31F06C|nr:hypothetical protein [Membranihabitans marinus]
MFYNYIINILSLELVQTRELWIDVLVYVAMALGFLILGYFLYKVYNEKRIKDLENEILMDKDRLERRISILERELQHKYTKEDELLVIINNLKQKLSKAKFDDDSTDWHFELYSHISTRKSKDEEE